MMNYNIQLFKKINIYCYYANAINRRMKFISNVVVIVFLLWLENENAEKKLISLLLVIVIWM
jgi:hypothetical protein